ncbi:MAG: DUF1761 domain-containing protein [Alphaproteobacteria bacterium]|nr:DUF1761 domain-containing protein [Alphaproteobacteria bacterium]
MTIEWDVNYLAALVAAAAAMAIGAIYYLPAVAGRAWMKAIGKTEQEVRAANRPILYVVTAILAFLQAIMLSAVVGWAGTQTLVGGALIGLLLWIGMAVPIVSVTFVFEGRTVANHVISGVYYLLSLVIMGGIVGAWG